MANATIHPGRVAVVCARRIRAIAAIAAMALAGATGGEAAVPVTGTRVRIASVATRTGVTVPVLVAEAASPAAVFVLFPGGNGAGHFRLVDGRVQTSNNFLLRVFPLFVDGGVTALVLGPPSDQAAGMSDVFRMSAEHAQDVAAVLDSGVATANSPRFLVGTSRGTLSVAALASGALGKSAIAGAVLTASIGIAVNPPPNHLTIKDAALAATGVPLLFLHHREDRCVASPYGEASRLARGLAATAKVAWVQAIGGASPLARPCEALTPHGFLGLEKPAASVLVQWAAGKPVPDVIGP